MAVFGKENMTDIPLPEAFESRMRKLLEEREYAAFMSSYGQKRRYSLRINPLKTEHERALQLLPGDLLQQVPWEPDGFYYQEDLRPGRLPWHEAGMYYIQEASAMAPAVLCGVKPGERVLDLCAAPGGKSTKLAACLGGEGILVANEIHPERAKILSSNLERMGVRNALVTNETPQRLASRFPLFFDRIVVDAPCSGEGMFRKEEEALKNWSPENVRMCAARQSEILEEAAAMLRPGGTLVYSTCTFSPEENEGVIFRFLIDHTDFRVVNIFDMSGLEAAKWGFCPGRPEWLYQAGIDPAHSGERGTETAEMVRGTVRLWPHLLDGEGHYAAVLKKRDLRPSSISLQIEKSGYLAEYSFDIGAVMTDPDRQSAKKRFKKDKGKGKGKGRIGKGRNAGRKQAENPAEEVMRMWEDFCRENLLLPDAPQCSPTFFDDNMILFGSSLYGLPLPAQMSLEGLRVVRAGLQLGTVVRGRFEPSHSLAMALRKEEVLRSVDLGGGSPEAYAWLRGESISLGENSDKGWTLVQIDGCSAGWGKANGGILKNHYPKGLRKGSSYSRG